MNCTKCRKLANDGDKYCGGCGEQLIHNVESVKKQNDITSNINLTKETTISNNLEITCPLCDHRKLVSSEKIPSNKAVNITCPVCGHSFTFNSLPPSMPAKENQFIELADDAQNESSLASCFEENHNSVQTLPIEPFITDSIESNEDLGFLFKEDPFGDSQFFEKRGTENFESHNAPASNLPGSLIGLLRIFRGFFGVWFAIGVITLFPFLSWLQQPSAVTGGMWAQLLIKIVGMAVVGSLFYGMHSLTNWLHKKKYGTPHPALDTYWAL